MPNDRKIVKNTCKLSIKNDFVINPVTGRLVKINSRKHLQLIKDAILNIPPTGRVNKVLYEGNNCKDVIKGMKTDKKHVLVTRNGKIFKQTRKLNAFEYINHTVKKCVELIKNDVVDWDVDEMDEDELDEQVRELLHQKLVSI